MLSGLRWLANSSFLWETEPTIYVDPWKVPTGAPGADVILVTHPHRDHFSPEDISRIRQPHTEIWAPADVAGALDGARAISPGDAFQAAGLPVDAVPAYNAGEARANHPKERGWVGYVLAVNGTRYYHAGDTDRIPEMESIDCDVAMLPIGGKWTMDPVEAAEAAKVLKPKLIVPMHYGFVAGVPSDAARFAKLVAPLQVHALIPETPFEL